MQPPFHRLLFVIGCLYWNILNIHGTDCMSYLERKEMFYLMTHSSHFIYGYMVSDIW